MFALACAVEYARDGPAATEVPRLTEAALADVTEVSEDALTAGAEVCGAATEAVLNVEGGGTRCNAASVLERSLDAGEIWRPSRMERILARPDVVDPSEYDRRKGQ